jgi:hypothetical protein
MSADPRRSHIPVEEQSLDEALLEGVRELLGGDLEAFVHQVMRL